MMRGEDKRERGRGGEDGRREKREGEIVRNAISFRYAMRKYCVVSHIVFPSYFSNKVLHGFVLGYYICSAGT